MNFNGFAKLVRGLQRTATAIAPTVASEVEALVKRQFETGTDPHGQAYAPLAASTRKRHGGSGSPLQTWGRYVKVKPIGKGRVLIVIDDKRARFHQKGTNNMPARPLVPDGTPETWHKAIEEAFRAGVRKQVTA